MLQGLADGDWQVMAWYRQAAGHYLNQCWLSSMRPYGVTKPQSVKNTKDYIWFVGRGPNLHDQWYGLLKLC